MSSQHSIGSMNQLADAFDEVGITPEMVVELRHYDMLTQVKLVLLGLATVVRSLKLTLDKTFNPSEFIGKGWTAWKGSADGDGLTGDEDRDVREDVLSEINWSQAEFETRLEEGESLIKGEEKLCQLKKSGKIRFGGRAFLSLWKDYQERGEASVLEQLYKVKGITYVDFMGLVVRAPDGDRVVLCLSRGSDGGWGWCDGWLDYGRDGRDFSAVSAQVSL